MAYLGKTDCCTCGHEVDVRSNVTGRAYYKCGRCGVVVTQKEERGNREFAARIRPEPDPDAESESSRESREIAKQKTAAPAPQNPAKPEPSPAQTKPRGGWFGGVLT
jgi:hypothetical protein